MAKQLTQNQQQLDDLLAASFNARNNEPQYSTYEELKWNDKPLYCPDDLELQHMDLNDTVGGGIVSGAADEDMPRRSESYNNNSVPPPPPPPCRIPIHAGKTALLIVDVQPEYWSSCPSVRQDFPHFEENLARTIDIARKQRAKIIWVRADYRKHHSPWLIQFERLNRGQRPDTIVELPCEPDSDEFKWEDFATPEGGEAIIAKSSWSSTSNTALMDILRASAIDTVLVCGLITSVCVQHSAFGVFEAGYRTLLVQDACADRGRARHEAALALYGGYMYELITSVELLDPVHGLQKAKPVWITVDDTRGEGIKRRGISMTLGEEVFENRPNAGSSVIANMKYYKSALLLQS
eukprot:CAMPEP_0176483622 /NCGR_PEP_ID=MMETSP0200_2-20121128/4018_1 /TAXON_ID=947934 /ORGANISM="Chaetoceros sp., Strain GSL56" /LENGTH=350 /DNA_ID=CAMNT_0017880039 /DNA_START=84 /DNA_END=1136 /DNA_ORIENTATION=+